MIHLVWCGQHTRGKALNVLLNAVYGLVSDWHLDVIGDGHVGARYRHLASHLGLDNRITWRGWVAHDRVQEIMASADVFVITSLRDLTSTVLLEALSLGKPVVCLDHCGFADVVDETCGIKIPVGGPNTVIRGFADALKRLEDDELRKRLSLGARAKAEKYLWSEKGKVLKRIYGASGQKVLAAVYACSPYHGSEPGEGWHYLKAIAEENEVWALVEQEKWQGDIEHYLREHPSELGRVHWIFIHKPRARLLRKIWPPSYYWFYRIWQKRAYRKALELDAKIHFTVFHQLNMVTFREPGYLWRFDRRFIWGPIGGLGYTDWRLLPLMGIAGILEFSARNIINWCHSHFLIRPRLAARRAAESGGLITATVENQRMAKSLWGTDSTVLCEIGVDEIKQGRMT